MRVASSKTATRAVRRSLQQHDNCWRFLDEGARRDGVGNGALRAGLEPGTPIVDSFVVLSEVSACMLVVAIMCMPFCATLSKSTLFCGDVICVAARAPTYVQARRYFA